MAVSALAWLIASGATPLWHRARLRYSAAILSKRLGLEFKTSYVYEYEHATEVLLLGLGCRATSLDHGQGEGQVLNVRPEHDEAVWAALAAAES